MKNKELITFENKKVRRVLVNDQWYFSVVDIVAVLTEQTDYQTARKYWNKLKERLLKEGSQSVTNCHQLKLTASDGKKYKTDCTNLENCFRIIQSIPSPKAEPFKLWLAKVGYERMQEIENPELSQERMMEIYRQKGYHEDWIKMRVQSIIQRKELTNEWDVRGATQEDYSVFTAIMQKETFGLKPSEHKQLKGLKQENLRDHMTNLELTLAMLGEVTAKEIHKTRNTQGKKDLTKDVKRAGQIAGETREKIEIETGKKVVNKSNYLELEKNKIEK